MTHSDSESAAEGATGTTTEPISGDVSTSIESTGDQPDTTSPETGEERGRKRTFGSLTPQEAGRRSAERRAERERQSQAEAAARSDGRVVVMRVPVAIGDIIARLSTDAAKGDVGAARELRAYMAEHPAEDTTDIAALDRRTIQEMKARLLAEIEADRAEAASLATILDAPAEPQREATPASAGTPSHADA